MHFTYRLKYSGAIFRIYYSFKNLLCAIIRDKKSTVRFLQEQKVLQSTVYCPGPLVQGQGIGGCGQLMKLKETNDSKDLFMWRCQHIHTVQCKNMTCKVKDIKLSIRHNSWLVDSKMTLEHVLELIFLWSQGFTHSGSYART